MTELPALPSQTLCRRLGIAHPIILAPMGGGAGTPELVAAVANAGGLGSLGAPYLTPDQIRRDVAEIRRRTEKPFAVNLFAGGWVPASGDLVDPAPMMAALARHHARLGLPPPEPPAPARDPFPAQLEAVIEAKPAVFSFTSGIPSPEQMARLKQQGCFVMGTATTVAEARLLASAGVDAVVTQGSEAGAHRGTFVGPYEMAMIGTMALVPQIVDAIPGLPVIAAGGIMDGRGIVAALALGAASVQLGTAFLACDEAGTPPSYKERLLAASDDSTAITRAYSGRPARGIRTQFMREVERRDGPPILPFPLQNSLTRPMRSAAGKLGESELQSLWAGQGLRLIRRLPAAELVRRLVAEMAEVRRRLAG